MLPAPFRSHIVTKPMNGRIAAARGQCVASDCGRSPRVSIGSPTAFYTFDLARQLARLKVLEKLYTAYPRWGVNGVPRDRICSFPWVYLPFEAAGRAGVPISSSAINRLKLATFYGVASAC